MKKVKLLLASLALTSILLGCYQKPKEDYFTVYFDSDGGTSVEPIYNVEYDTAVGETRKPKDPNKQDNIWNYRFDGWYNNGAIFDLVNTHIYGDTYLKAKWIQESRKTYRMMAANGEHLIFTKTDGQEFSQMQITAGEPLSFLIKLNEDSSNGDIGYVLPSSINIYVNDSTRPLTSGYTITPQADNKTALVTIDANKVVGDISITGDAVLEGSYHYEVLQTYGVETSSKSGDVSTETFKLSFVPMGPYDLPKAENIYIQFDDAEGDEPIQWISPKDYIKWDEYCTYDEKKGVLTIKSNHINNNIRIVARAHSCPLLDLLSWKEIEELSFENLAPYIFYLGEEKKIILNEQIHRVRIIGFNQDYCGKVSNRVGITFEFANVISDSQGQSLAIPWNDVDSVEASNDDYTVSTIDNALNGRNIQNVLWAEKGKTTWSKKYVTSVYEMLPYDLKQILKSVTKSVSYFDYDEVIYKEKWFNREIFLLSPKEMGFENDLQERTTFTYDYYYNCTESVEPKRIKRQVAETEYSTDSVGIAAGSGQVYSGGVSNSAGYNEKNWGSLLYTRSPYTLNSRNWDDIWALYEGGCFREIEYACSQALAIAPGFCV